MKKVLLTNDDSHSSPLLRITIECLAPHFDLTIVVPKHEQSWKGKSITCFEPLHVEEISLFGHPAYTVDGTPADCVNLGIYNICAELPDLVVSGLNTGLNTGVGFLFSSGTVGAALEANIAGIPAVAFSQAFEPSIFRHYIAHQAFSDEVRDHIDQSSRRSFSQTFELFLKNKQLLRSDLVWNINFPYNRKADTKLTLCGVAKSYYSQLFRFRENRYEHHLAVESIRREVDSVCDFSVIQSGDISCSPIEISRFGQLDEQRFAREKAIFDALS